METNWPDEARSFAAADPLTDKIGQNVADFLAADMKRGIIPPTFLPLQSGVGNIANAVLGALGLTRPSRRLKCTQKSSRTPLSDLSAKAA